MQYGIEARPVFLDHRWIECAWKYHYRYFLHDGVISFICAIPFGNVLTPRFARTDRNSFARATTGSVYDGIAEAGHDQKSPSVKHSGL